MTSLKKAFLGASLFALALFPLLGEPAKSEGLSFITLPEGLEFPWCPECDQDQIDHQRRDFSHYSLCYRESYEQAEWSAYRLDREELHKTTTRTDDFRPDPLITTGSASLADYRKSGYDRGHLSPAADFSFDENAMSETFYMSNMSPQTAGLNRGLWKDLESHVRYLCRRYGRVYVISGPVLNKDCSEFETIGPNKVAVPQSYYKVLLVPIYLDADDMDSPDTAYSLETIGFIMPNQKLTGTIFDYSCTVDKIEEMTGLDFFYTLDKEVQDSIEKEYHKEIWD